MGNREAVPFTFNVELPCDPAISLFGAEPEKWKHTSIKKLYKKAHSSTSDKSHKLGTTQLCRHRDSP